MPLFNLRPLTDEDRYMFAGEPETCLECGEKFIIRQFPSKTGRTIQIFCPRYGSNPDRHEFYRWEEPNA